PEQELLRDNVARLMKDRYGFEARKTFQASPRGWSEALWRDYAELGLLGAPFAEADGGFDGGAVETMIVMEQFGKALALEPYLQTVVLCGALLRHGASDKQRAELIGAIATGELKLSFAQMEKQSGYDLNDVALSAVKDGGGGFVLNGEKTLVGQGDSADKLIVSARVSGERRSRDGIVLFLVDANAPGVSRRGYPTQDGQRAAEIGFADVRVAPHDLLGGTDSGLPGIDGAAEERAKTMSAVKVQIGRSAKFVGEQAVQMHGGIAMTYEYKAGHLFKRLTMLDPAYG